MNKEKFDLIFSNNLNEILKSYYLYLLYNDIKAKNNVDYINYILENFNLQKYVHNFSIENNLNSNGRFVPNINSIFINQNYLRKLEIAQSLNFLNKEQIILEYFTLLFHEINHALQYKTMMELERSLITEILHISLFLKSVSNYNEFLFHNLFPDEINSNINSSLLVYSFVKNNLNLNLDINNAEKNLIYYLSLGYINTEGVTFPCSQIKFLYSVLCNKDFCEDFYGLNDNEKIFYGFSKNAEFNKKIIKSYQTQKLCFDINERKKIL